MGTAIRAGRIIGILLIGLMVGSGIVNFVLEAPLFGAPGFLVNAASHSDQIGLAALLGPIIEAMWLGIAITAFPIFCRRSQAMAMCLVALAAAILAIAVVESACVMSMVSLSQAYVKADGAEREQLETIRVVVASARNWTHFLARITDGSASMVFYAVLLRFALIPRVLAGLGLIAGLLLIASLARPLFGHDVIFPMLAPMGLAQLVTAIWLIAKGFASDGVGDSPDEDTAR